MFTKGTDRHTTGAIWTISGQFGYGRAFSDAMQTRLTLEPGQRGTKKLLARYGDKLVCVRYRYDEQREKRYKTVELIVEEVDWEPKPKWPSGETIVDIKVGWGEVELGRQVRRAGGRWNPGKKVWELRYDQVLALGLEDRIVEGSR